MGKKTGKNISINWRSKYSKKPLNQANQSATDALRTSSTRATEKAAETIGGFIGNTIADTIESQKRHNRIMLKSPKQRQKIIDDLRLIY